MAICPIALVADTSVNRSCLRSADQSLARRPVRSFARVRSRSSLQARRESATEGAIFVFENRPGSGSVAHRSKKAASVLCRSLTFEFRAHDLRRTAATRMAEAGIPRDHIAKVLNHVEGGPAATRVYDRYNYDAEKRDALDRWARGLAAIIEGKTKKVVPFRA
jgi:integrase